MERLAQGGEILSVVPQNVYEFWVVATRPVAVRGLGLSVADAIVEREHIERLFTLRRDPPDLYDRWAQIVAAHGVSDKPAHDARIVAAMLAHGISRILTFNGGDFLRFAPLGIVVVDPASV